MSGTSSRSQKARSSISPLQSRKSPAAPQPAPSMSKTGARPTTPSCSRPSSSKVTVSPANSTSPSTPSLDRPDLSKAKENVTVTVRLRPLSAREINKGDEIAWYADGDCTIRDEYNPSISYGFELVEEEEDEIEGDEISQFVADFQQALDHPKVLRRSKRLRQKAATQGRE